MILYPISVLRSAFVFGLLCFGGSALFAQTASLPKTEEADVASIERRMRVYMDAYTQRNLFTGAVLVAKQGKPLFRQFYGSADYSQKPLPPLTPETPLIIFSMTKQFTAACILLLQERGQLSVKDSVGKYFLEWPAAWKNVTLHHLLTHSSGLDPESAAAWWDGQTKGKLRFPGYTPPKTLRLRPKAAPGETFEYSNLGYVLLAEIVAKVSGKSYRDFLKENIFTPLGMTHSDSYQPGVKETRAHGHLVTGNTPYPIEQETHYIIGAGDIYSTADDLLKWDQALQEPGFLKRESLRAMFTPWKDDYGYGWNIEEKGGHLNQSHSGGGLGFEAMIIRLPKERLTSIVLSNQSGHGSFGFADTLMHIALGEQVPQPFPNVPTRLLDRYAGKYKGEGHSVQITRGRERGSLNVTIGTKFPLTVYAGSNTEFGGGPLLLRFLRDKRGRVTGVELLSKMFARKLKKIR